MKKKKPRIEVDEEFVRAGLELYRTGQRRSLIATITMWLELAPNPTACLLVNTETIFPRTCRIEPKVAKFLPEVYACIDQLLIALTYAAAELHKAAEEREEGTERTRIAVVAEIFKCLATHVYSIRQLSLTGFDVQVKQIVRTYIEYLELLALVCADTKALDEFIASGEADQENAFWHQHLSKAKARKKRYANSVLKSDLPSEEQEKDRKWHEDQSKLLSACAHPTLSAVLGSGAVTYDPFIRSFDHEAVIGSLIYTFTAFADTLEISTIDYLRSALNKKKEDKTEKPEQDEGAELKEVGTISRFYTLFMLAVMLGYRKDYVFFGDSNIEKDTESAVQDVANRKQQGA